MPLPTPPKTGLCEYCGLSLGLHKREAWYPFAAVCPPTCPGCGAIFDPALGICNKCVAAQTAHEDTHEDTDTEESE